MKYPIGIQNFESLREDGYVYVDKTAIIHRLVNTGRYYFLSRPRRFGKSMLISTLDAYLSGKRELFEGLAIERLEKDWTAHPVLHIDLNTAKYDCLDALVSLLNDTLSRWESVYGASPTETTLALRFGGIIRRAAEKEHQRVAILVDEYDKPMLQAIGNDELQQEYRTFLKAFYSVLKTQDRYIKFALLTGVTKFGKVSVFSDLNNLNDISMNANYHDLCGITEEELHGVFGSSVKELAAANGMTEEACYDLLRRRFDGYHFEVDTPGLYNPFSLLKTFYEGKVKNFWFETGTPTFLVELLKQSDYDLSKLQDGEVSGEILNSVDSMKVNPVPIIYQSGYLTLKKYDKRFDLYSLGFPNEEVETGFFKYLMPYYTPVEKSSSEFFVLNFVRDVEQGKPEGFMQRLETLFEDNDYRVAGDMEKYFQNAMYVVFKMMGFYTEVEHSTARGRIDVLLKTQNYVYIIEAKLDGTADEALRQIEAKGYAKPYIQDPRRLYRIGVSFSSETRGVKEWKIEG